VVIGDDDLRLFQIGQHVLGNQFPPGVVTVRIAGVEYPEPVPDGEPGVR
jgi:hypothetical protein